MFNIKFNIEAWHLERERERMRDSKRKVHNQMAKSNDKTHQTNGQLSYS